MLLPQENDPCECDRSETADYDDEKEEKKKLKLEAKQLRRRLRQRRCVSSKRFHTNNHTLINQSLRHQQTGGAGVRRGGVCGENSAEETS